jgi:ketosteroid isomerase-like protein
MDDTEIIRELYRAFARRDADAMMRCYHPEVAFRDPVFGELAFPQVQTMWTMLCARGKDLVVELVRCEAEGGRGVAEWEAKYTFQKTGKFVHNKISSRFVFKDSLIVQQTDDFDFWKWASMALGASGRLLGWTPVIKNAVRKEAKRSLSSFGQADKSG